ncbi:MAG: glycosyltransferase family 4 protein [Alphaproteobacteria bacterium]|nr:glycosyltransferase family 4 protein [Alphaproteobacteria bacterium]
MLASAPLLLFLVTEDWYFCSHRLPLARAALREGFRVAVMCRVNRHAEIIRANGIALHPWGLDRRSLGPRAEMEALIEVVRLYKSERPTLVHHLALKPIIYGSIAARTAGVPHGVNALAGLGTVFTEESWRARALRRAVAALLRLTVNGRSLYFLSQNADDLVRLQRAGVLKPATPAGVIRGSGVDTAHFAPMPEPPAPPVVAALVARMLRSKGVPTFVAAARILMARGAPVRLRLVGAPDPASPASVTAAEIEGWVSEGVVDWAGHVDDVRAVWRDAHIGVLPSSYGEGLPKSLLEAAACGRPVIATDIAGCREIARHGETGLLVTKNDPAALADAIERLASDAEMRRGLGSGARALVERELSADVVVRETLALYRRLLGPLYPSA